MSTFEMLDANYRRGRAKFPTRKSSEEFDGALSPIAHSPIEWHDVIRKGFHCE
jgi:hypothetical protein